MPRSCMSCLPLHKRISSRSCSSAWTKLPANRLSFLTSFTLMWGPSKFDFHHALWPLAVSLGTLIPTLLTDTHLMTRSSPNETINSLPDLCLSPYPRTNRRGVISYYSDYLFDLTCWDREQQVRAAYDAVRAGKKSPENKRFELWNVLCYGLALLDCQPASP